VLVLYLLLHFISKSKSMNPICVDIFYETYKYTTVIMNRAIFNATGGLH